MKLRHLQAAFVLSCSLLAAAAAQALPFTLTFDVQPGTGAIRGTAGQTVGWGYRLENTDTANWFVPTALSASSFSIGTPDGSYFDFPILAPGAGADSAFDPVLHAGLYGVQIDPSALPTQRDSGAFTLSGEWWSGDPFAGGSFLRASDALLVPLSVEVVEATAAVPLPGSLPLVALGLALLAGRERRGKKRAQVGAALR